MIEEQDQQRKYLYCVIGNGGERTFDAEAIGGRGDVVHTVAFDGLATVVSNSPDQRYDHSRANMVAHEMVIERVMEEGFTVLPMRFGTVTADASKNPGEDIRQRVLRAKSQEFRELLREMEDKVEMGLKALWRDEKAIFEEIVAEDREIRRLRDSLRGRPAQATRYERIDLGQRVKAAIDRKREEEARRLLSVIQPSAYRVRENKAMLDRMVLNAAFLVTKDREEELDEMVRRLDRELGERMTFKYSGPNPPFNFVEIVVSWGEE